MLKFLRLLSHEGKRLVPLDRVVECLPMVELEDDSTSPNPHFRGLLHYRGRVIPVFDPAGSHQKPVQPQWFLLVVDADDQEVAIVALDLYDIVESDERSFRRLRIGADQCVPVVSFENDYIRVLEPEALIHS